MCVRVNPGGTATHLTHMFTHTHTHSASITSLKVTIKVTFFLNDCLRQPVWNNSTHLCALLPVSVYGCASVCSSDSWWCKIEQTFLSEVISGVLRPKRSRRPRRSHTLYCILYADPHSAFQSVKSPLLMCHTMTFTSRIYLEVITSLPVECFKWTVEVTVWIKLSTK